MASPFTYSFMSVVASIVGPNGAFSIGYGSGNDDGGITVEYAEDRGALTTGADGTPMHTLHASRAGRCSVRLLKTSPTNALLNAMFNADSAGPENWGQNTITISDVNRGDLWALSAVSFQRHPTTVYAKEGTMMEWTFLAGTVEALLGAGLSE